MKFGIAGRLIVLLCFLSPRLLRSQTNPVPAAAHMESSQELLARLTPPQKQQFDEAGKAFDAKRFVDALALYKVLLKDLPGDPVLSKFSSEAAINTGDPGFAVAALEPIAQTNPDDWQAAVLLTRAYAESGDKAGRDAAIAHMLDLHKRGITPQQINQYIVERVKAGDKTVIIFASLEPWGRYHVYDYGRVFDADGHLLLRITVESDDFDQPAFVKNHPAEAAAGVRAFSIDGYRDTGTNNSGQRTETHYTFRLLQSQPTYDALHDAFVSIALGETKPVSSRTNVLSQ